MDHHEDTKVTKVTMETYPSFVSSWFKLRYRALLVVVVATGCKDRSAAKPAEPVHVDPSVHAGSASGSAVVTATPRPELPKAAVDNANPPEPMTIDDARSALPKIDGKVILDLKQTSDRRQVHATWCIDGSGADDVARQVGQWMAEAGYSSLSIRGDARKAGVSGDRGTIRLSMIVAASGAANCPAPEHYFASATIFRP